VPVLASFIMVSWDLSMDPPRAMRDQSLIWHDGGGYCGVPFSNFMGWSSRVYTIFQAPRRRRIRSFTFRPP